MFVVLIELLSHSCKGISLNYCPSIRCLDNAHLKCKVENFKCVCPSCDDVTDTNQCTRTKYVLQSCTHKPPHTFSWYQYWGSSSVTKILAFMHTTSHHRCLEQRTKPPCRVDPCTRRCRCPNCGEQPDRAWCERTYCGPSYHLQCR